MNKQPSKTQEQQYMTLQQIAKGWWKENYDPYKDILGRLFIAFWQGHFDQEAYILNEGALIPKNKKEAKKNGTKVNRESMLILLPTMAAYMPDVLKGSNTSLAEKYKAMAKLEPDEYKDSLIEMERIVIPLTKKNQIKDRIVTRKRKFSPRGASIGQLMFDNANIFAKNRNGALIKNDQMLAILKEQKAIVKKSDNEYVIHEDTITKESITLKKKTFQNRMTRIRKQIKKISHT